MAACLANKRPKAGCTDDGNDSFSEFVRHTKRVRRAAVQQVAPPQGKRCASDAMQQARCKSHVPPVRAPTWRVYTMAGQAFDVPVAPQTAADPSTVLSFKARLAWLVRETAKQEPGSAFGSVCRAARERIVPGRIRLFLGGHEEELADRAGLQSVWVCAQAGEQPGMQPVVIFALFSAE